VLLPVPAHIDPVEAVNVGGEKTEDLESQAAFNRDIYRLPKSIGRSTA